MKYKVLAFVIFFFLSWTNVDAANAQLSVSKTGLNGSWGSSVSVNPGSDYYYQIVYTGGASSDDLKFNLPAETSFSSKLSANVDPSSTSPILFSNQATVIYKFKVSTNANVVSSSEQFIVDNNDDNNFTDLISNQVNIQVSSTVSLSSAKYQDLDSDGKLDTVILLFSKGITGNTSGLGFSIDQGDCASARTINSGSVSTNKNANDTLTFSFSECSKTDTGTKPDILYNSAVGNISDGSNFLASIASADLLESDEAAPVLISNSSLQLAENADILVEFSEAISVRSAPASLECASTSISGTFSVVSASKTNNSLLFNPSSNLSSTCTLTLNANQISDGLNYLSKTTINITVTSSDTSVPQGSTIGSNTGIEIASGSSYTKETKNIAVKFLATDDSSGLSKMCVSGDISNNLDCSVTSNFTTYLTSKSYSLTSGDGVKTIQVKFQDKAGNISDTYSDTIILDTVNPITVLNKDEGTYSAEQTILISANEDSTIYYLLLDDSSQNCPVYSGTNYSSNSYTISGSSITVSDSSDTEIGNTSTNPDKLCYFSTDLALNRETPIKSAVYTVDNTTPTIQISDSSSSITNSFFTNGSDVSLTISSNGNYNYSIETDSVYQGGGALANLVNGSLGADNLETVTINIADITSSGENVFYVFVANGANVSKSKILVYKDQSAVGTASLVINNSDTYTNSQNVSLSIAATDNLTGVKEMAISETASPSNFEAFSKTKNFSLTSSQGTKTLYVRFRDYAGNVSNDFSDTIILDSTQPTSTGVVINSDASHTNSRTVQISLNASDGDSGLAYMAVSEDQNNFNDEIYAATKTFTLSSSEGEKTVYVRLKDKAGNVSSILSDKIIYDTTAPTISLSHNSQDFSFSFTATFSANETATIYYTLDDTNPNSSSLSSSLPFNFSTGNQTRTIKYYAQDSAGNKSSTATLKYNYLAPSSGLSGGGGGGGPAGIDLNSTYSVPELPSDTQMVLPRPVRVENGKFNRPVKIENYFSKSFTSIPKYTEVVSLDKKPFTGEIKPVFSTRYNKFDKQSLPSKSLLYGGIYTVAGEGLLYSKRVESRVFLPSGLTNYLKDNPQDLSIYYWVPNTKFVSAFYLASDAKPSLGSWQILGGVEKLVDNEYLDLSLDFSTYLLFASNAEAETTVSDSNSNIKLSDISGHWAENDINTLYNLGVVKGQGDTGKFLPDSPINRAAFLKIILELFDYDIGDIDLGVTIFDDLDLDAWYAPYVHKAFQEGIIQGYKIENRQEARQKINFTSFQQYNLIEVSRLQNFLQEYGYTDFPATGYYGNDTKSGVEKFQKENDLEISGNLDKSTLAKMNDIYLDAKFLEAKKTYLNYFQASKLINRAEALKIILKAAKISSPAVSKAEFADVPVDSWFAPFVNYAATNEIVKGKKPGLFFPSDNISRAETVKVALKIYELLNK